MCFEEMLLVESLSPMGQSRREIVMQMEADKVEGEGSPKTKAVFQPHFSLGNTFISKPSIAAVVNLRAFFSKYFTI